MFARSKEVLTIDSALVVNTWNVDAGTLTNDTTYVIPSAGIYEASLYIEDTYPNLIQGRMLLNDATFKGLELGDEVNKNTRRSVRRVFALNDQITVQMRLDPERGDNMTAAVAKAMWSVIKLA